MAAVWPGDSKRFLSTHAATLMLVDDDGSRRCPHRERGCRFISPRAPGLSTGVGSIAHVRAETEVYAADRKRGHFRQVVVCYAPCRSNIQTGASE